MKKLENVVDRNRDVVFELLRIYLGLSLLVVGINFAINQDQAIYYLELGKIQFFPFIFVHYIVLAHVCGGFLLAIGLITRAAALIQLPVLLGAVFLVHAKSGFFSAGQCLEFSSLVTVLLLVFFVYGGGRYSSDFFLRKRFKK